LPEFGRSTSVLRCVRPRHARLSELVGSEVRLEPIPPPSDKDAYRAPRETKADIRAHFGLAEDEPLPDFSVFPLRKLADLNRYVTPVGSLFDAYPVHVITRASLAAMAALTPGADFDVRRFRPNLVVDTEPGEELPENSWCNADLDLPNAGLHGEIPTLRCVMPTREQRELPTDIQVLRTVAKHANRCLGIYATVSSPGTIGVGDEIVVRRPASPSRPTAMTRVGARSLKRGVLRAANAMMPKEGRRRRRRRGETRKANLEPSWLKAAMDRQWAPSAWRRAGAGHARR
jgi:hypothetical protein